MCESRDGVFVVPQKPSAGMGWWIGQALSEASPTLNMNGRTVALRQVSVLHVQNADYSGSPFIVAGDVDEFDTLSEAIEHLAGKGVLLV